MSKCLKLLLSGFIAILFYMMPSLTFAKEWPLQENVSVDKVWKVKFNQPVMKESVSHEFVQVTDSKGNEHPVNLELSHSTLMVSPQVPYDKGQTYTLTINGLQSVYAKPLKEKTVMRFTVSEKRTKEEILKKWEQYETTFEGDPYIEEPSILLPYKTGKLHPQFIEDGVKMANFMRYLAGLPDDLEEDQLLNENAQYGAVLLAKNDRLSHYPPKPEDMSEEFYQLGYQATRSSNLSSSRSTLEETVISYMQDFGDSNLESVGHRRWILNPQLKKIGFGYYNQYSAMKVFDRSREERIDYDYIPWPSEGYFPSELFLAQYYNYGSNPWNVTLNPDKYDNTRIEDIKVELRNQNNKTEHWVFTHEDYAYGSSKFLKVDQRGYGVPYSIIFRPDQVEEYKKGHTYSVHITGLFTVSGEPDEISYEVSFF
ncbi:hypothetical protein CD798_15975 [Bacillaceae bacterium SAOS 7]|nr:hypothetical protein CD798_15975 [Bacillaceae bacterium SAOS 7]